MNSRKLFAWLLALVAPTVLWSSYIYLSRMTRSFSAVTDYVVLVVMVAIGLSGVLLLARPGRARVVAAALYIVVASSGMYFGMLASACAIGDCP